MTSLAFWRGFVRTMRPYLLFVSGAAGLVGLALVPELGAAATAVAGVVFFLTYGLGQALTDTSQMDTDTLSAPERPLVRGEIGRRPVLVIALLGLLACGGTLAALNPWTLVVSALCIVGLATYTPLKRRWWGGPPWNSAVVALLPLLGALCLGGTPLQALARPGVVAAMASCFFSYAVFVLLGYLKDVEADRATGYDTLAVHFGRRAAVVASALFGLAAVVASAVLLRIGLPDAMGLSGYLATGLWGLGVLLLAGAHLRGWTVTEDAQAYPAITWSVEGFVALHLGEAALLRPGLAAVAVVAFPLAIASVAVRPTQAQV